MAPAAAVLLGLALLTSCDATPREASPATRKAPSAVVPTRAPEPVPVDEMSSHPGRVCPGELPLGLDPGGHGFGTEEPATALPSLLTPQHAWVCRYAPVRTSRSTPFRWQREGGPREVDQESLGLLVGHLDDLALPDPEVACPADLGWRWMLTFVHQQDITGVVMDDYGCGDVRLTNEPFRTAPGDGAADEAVVPGTLEPPPGMLATVQDAYGS